MYEARALSNFLLSEWQPDHLPLTNLRINKILYFIQLWSLRHESRGIVRNHFEAWTLGPVIKSVYEEFLKYGDGRIVEMAKFVEYASGDVKFIPFDGINEAHRRLIRNVSKYYAHTSTGRLVDLSHEPDGPWAQVWSRRPAGAKVGGRISNELLRAYLADSGCAKLNH